MSENLERKVYWLASYPKSGNTWVRMFLDCYVTGFPVKFSSAYKYVQLDHDMGMMQLVSAQPRNELTLEYQFMYHSAVIANLLTCAKTKDIVVKTHNAKITVSGMPLIPTPISGGAIYIVRDPRDVVISYSHHLNKSIDETIEIMANEQHAATSRETSLFHIMSTWSMHVQSWMQLNVDIPVAIVKYEDLLENPDPMFRNILRSLGVTEIDEEMFQFALKQTTFKNLSELEDKQGFIERSDVSKEKFFRVGKAKQWQTQLLSHQADAIFNTHADAMKLAGYIM
ncbi:MAG: sulfotransferase domain-containing protein [Euryarchaeota archaeon]|nr:sulfotransferase domain-containing protein [Euryarchaeota archaeon]